jgi:signal peptidase II
MKKNPTQNPTHGYLLLGVLLVLLDQLTKWIALYYWQSHTVVTSFLSFQVTLNRGISWGLLRGAETNSLLFLGVSICIMLLTFGLAIYAAKRYQKGYRVYGEVLVIAGSCSNIIDRCIHKGVIDFIMVHWGEYIWPVFNLADTAIVIGVFIMFVQHLTRKESRA